MNDPDQELTVVQRILAAPVMLLLALLSLFVSFGVPILLVALLVWGPSDTWHRVQRAVGMNTSSAPAGCDSVDDWYRDFSQRAESAYNLNHQIVRRDIDSIEGYRSARDQFRSWETAQRASSPPPKAQALNDLATRSYGAAADALSALIDGDTVTANQIWSGIGQQADTADRLDKELRQSCF